MKILHSSISGMPSADNPYFAQEDTREDLGSQIDTYYYKHLDYNCNCHIFNSKWATGSIALLNILTSHIDLNKTANMTNNEI